jgi:hypothetical protein
MPETEGCEHLIDYLNSISPGMSLGMGYVNLTWTEIDSWARRMKIPITGWESETLHRMSQAYCGQMSISSKKDCPAPWSKMAGRSIEINRDKVAEGTLKAFERAASKPAKKRAR